MATARRRGRSRSAPSTEVRQPGTARRVPGHGPENGPASVSGCPTNRRDAVGVLQEWTGMASRPSASGFSQDRDERSGLSPAPSGNRGKANARLRTAVLTVCQALWERLRGTTRRPGPSSYRPASALGPVPSFLSPSDGKVRRTWAPCHRPNCGFCAGDISRSHCEGCHAPIGNVSAGHVPLCEECVRVRQRVRDNGQRCVCPPSQRREVVVTSTLLETLECARCAGLIRRIR